MHIYNIQQKRKRISCWQWKSKLQDYLNLLLIKLLLERKKEIFYLKITIIRRDRINKQRRIMIEWANFRFLLIPYRFFKGIIVWEFLLLTCRLMISSSTKIKIEQRLFGFLSTACRILRRRRHFEKKTMAK